MRRSLGVLRSALALLTLLAAVVAGAQFPQVHVPGERRPAVLDELGPLDGLLALALSPDGATAAVALASTGRPHQTELRLVTRGEQPRSTTISGNVRDLLFSPEGDPLFALLHKPAKKREGDAYLARIDPATLKIRRSMRLPPSSHALDHWLTEQALLVACRNEIRTILLPGLRSGQLYRIDGENRSVASVGGGNLVLIGQDDGLLLVDLYDPPGADQMPIRERIDSAAPIMSLAVDAEGSGALAHLADGSLFGVEFLPLRLVDRGSTLAIAAPPSGSPAEAAIRSLERATRPAAEPLTPSAPPEPAEAAAPEPPPRERPMETAPARPATPPTTTPEPTVPRPVPSRPDEPEARPTVPAESQPALAPAPDAPGVELPAATDEPAPGPSRPAEAEGGPTAEAAPPSASPPPVTPRGTAPRTVPARAGMPQLSGRIAGPAAGEVVAVVLLGPDNILREAARLRPLPDGTWRAEGLSPGRYRVQLDGGGSRVLTTNPPFLIINLVEGQALEAPEFQVLRAF